MAIVLTLSPLDYNGNLYMPGQSVEMPHELALSLPEGVIDRGSIQADASPPKAAETAAPPLAVKPESPAVEPESPAAELEKAASAKPKAK